MLQESVATLADGPKPSVVIDSNVWISGLLYGGKPQLVLHYCLEHCRVVSSEYITAEVITFLKEQNAPYQWLRQLKRKMTGFESESGSKMRGTIRDIKDEPIIKLAKAHHAFIVSGDKDLLEYTGDPGVAVISTAEFLELFDK